MTNHDRPEISGALFGFDVEHRGKTVIGGTEYDLKPLLTLSIEDDEAWHRKPVTFDAGWLDDMILVCQRAKLHLGMT